jgi:signal transduction histidine kinase
VFEVYYDVTTLLGDIERRQVLMQLVVGGTFLLLYLLLIFGVWRSERQSRHHHRKNLDLARAAARAEEASRLKSEFLATMSHELRTPLNAILGFSEILKSQLPTANKEETRREYADSIWLSGHHLLNIVDDVLDMSKVEAGEMVLERESFDPVTLLESCLRLVEKQAEKQGVTLDSNIAGALPAAHGDERRIKQVLINLLSNAVKFTPEGGRISVWLGPAAGGDLQFSVSDSGIGIAPEHVGQLFSEFYQVDSTSTRRFEGTGLGLVITQRLCHMLGGEIRVTSAAGQGSIFTIELPAVHIEAGAPEVALELDVRAERDVARVRLEVRELCQRLGARPLALQKIATVVSELARNMVLYAGGGRLVVGSVGTDKKCVFIRAIDEGPGIPELDAILAGRNVRRNGRGLGLLGTKRLADGFRVHTAATGTWIEVEVNL